MKKAITTLVLVIIVFWSFAQNNQSNTKLVRHDTTLLKVAECEWIIKSLTKNNPELTSEIGKSIPLIILQAIEKGKLKAVDGLSGKFIPAKEIFNWQMPSDTVLQYDNEGNVAKFIVTKQQLNSSSITQIRIFQDWYFNTSTDKIQVEIKCIELLAEIYSSSGLFIGYQPFCNINY